MKNTGTTASNPSKTGYNLNNLRHVQEALHGLEHGPIEPLRSKFELFDDNRLL